MDKTKKYIRMCHKAEEIQEKWKPKEGDFYCYIDAMCGWPVYVVMDRHLQDMEKTDIMKGKTCPLCRYDYDSFQEIMAIGRKYRDALEGWFVWLPRQDQLQKMLDKWTLLGKIRGLLDFCEPELMCPDEPPCKESEKLGLYVRKTFSSIEQLWLGFVMKDKYNKVWKMREWVK